jgi:hypothetical protein
LALVSVTRAVSCGVWPSTGARSNSTSIAARSTCASAYAKPRPRQTRAPPPNGMKALLSAAGASPVTTAGEVEEEDGEEGAEEEEEEEEEEEGAKGHGEAGEEDGEEDDEDGDSSSQRPGHQVSASRHSRGCRCMLYMSTATAAPARTAV